MATLADAARNAACDAIVDLVDEPGGAGSGTGQLILTTSAGGAGTVLATIPLANTAFGSASSGAASLDVSPVPSATASNSGTAAGWAIRNDSGGTPTVIVSGTIGTGSEDLDIDNTSVTSGQTVNITSLTVTVPAS